MTQRFTCNICGTANAYDPEAHRRTPGALCSGCGSSVRFRKIAFLAATRIFGGPAALYQHAPNELVGVGLSDAPPYAEALARVSRYTNTFVHGEPYLDIVRGSETYRDLDYVISSDVFEHTRPPAARPFHTVYEMLRPGGRLLLSVPTTGRYIEHFPELHDCRLLKVGDVRVLVNATADGRLQVFDQLRFHGGPGETLEMRIYSVEAVERNLQAAGFSSWDLVRLNRPEFGIAEIDGLSTVWLAQK